MAAPKDTAANESADELSMEEILQSIRRIIAEENDEGTPSPETSEAEGDDVLELTEVVEDPMENRDPLAAIDAIMASSAAPEPAPMEAMAMPAPPTAPAPEMPRFEEPAPRAFEPRELPKAPPEPVAEDVLVSESTAAAAINSLRSVRDTAHRAAEHRPHGLTFRTGTTVEDLVIEALRPMLKDWLDTHLPHTVERIVQREIQRIAQEAGE